MKFLNDERKNSFSTKKCQISTTKSPTSYVSKHERWQRVQRTLLHLKGFFLLESSDLCIVQAWQLSYPILFCNQLIGEYFYDFRI